MATRLLDTITRIYKNLSGDVIGIQEIFLTETSQYPDDNPDISRAASLRDRVKRGVELKSTFCTFNLTMGGSRTITSVQQIGGYDEFVYVSGNTDIDYVTYFGDGDQVNDLKISMSTFFTVGDSI